LLRRGARLAPATPYCSVYWCVWSGEAVKSGRKGAAADWPAPPGRGGPRRAARALDAQFHGSVAEASSILHRRRLFGRKFCV